jgi:hypothetical protein
MLSALWDHGQWDSQATYWDQAVAEITAGWTENDDGWAGSLYIYIPATISWTSDDDSWAGSMVVTNKINLNLIEAIDSWQANIKITPPAVSHFVELPDIWTSSVWITYLKPLYNVGGTWWMNVWGDRLPDWQARRNAMEEAYDNWRYVSDWEWVSKCDSWSGEIETFNIHEESLRRQIRMMFGGVQDNHDEDEDLLWLF